MNKLGLLKQRGLCRVSCASTRACNPAPKVPLSKIFWLTFEFVPVIQKFSRASQVITCVIQSPTAKPLQSSQAFHLISLIYLMIQRSRKSSLQNWLDRSACTLSIGFWTMDMYCTHNRTHKARFSQTHTITSSSTTQS